MKQRQRGSVIFLRERRLGESVSSGTGKLAIAVLVDDGLEAGSRRAFFAERIVALAEMKRRARATGGIRILAEKLLVPRRGQVVHFAREQTVRVFKLTFIRVLFFS